METLHQVAIVLASGALAWALLMLGVQGGHALTEWLESR